MFEMTGVEQIDDALRYMKTEGANKVARACVRRMGVVLAQFIRPQIKKTIAPKTANRGIGARLTKGTLSSKAGVAVGKVSREAFNVVNRGKRKGVGISARNLHWFGMGTADRFTGEKSISTGRNKKTGKMNKRRKVKTGHPVKYTGKLHKTEFGGFIQRGASAGISTAVAEAAKTANRMIEAGALKAGVSPVLVEMY